MNIIEYNKVKGYNYEEYVPYLLTKYGKVGGDYYSEDFSVNTSIKRRDEELFIHHIREDKVANLSDKQIAQSAPYEYQKAENLCYANLLEHILLHILVGEKNEGLGFGGAELMFTQANDFYDSFDSERESVLADGEEVLELLKERCRNSEEACDILFQHNTTVFAEIVDTLDKYDRALAVIGPGLGKTTTALAYLKRIGKRGLVLGPNKAITDAWEKYSEVDVYTCQWFMNNYQTIDFSQYGVLICDEAHHYAAPKWGEGIRYVLDNGIIKVLGLTGTPKEKSDKNGETSAEFFNDHVCQGFTVLDGIEREIIHDFSYVGAIYDTSGIREQSANIKDEKLLGELDLALNNTPTMEEIFRRHLPASKRKGIVFCSNIKAIDEAEDIMRKVLPNAEFRRMHSQMGAEALESRKWFEDTDEGWLFAVNMISEGAHYKGVNTIVMFRRTQSSLVFNQQLGRIITLARDEDPEAIVFDLVNNANNITKGKSFAGSLKRAYQQRKEHGGKQKSEQVIVEDYAEKISEILEKIREENAFCGEAVYCIDKSFTIIKTYSRVGKTAQDGFKPNDVSQALMGKINNVDGYYWCFIKDYYEGWKPKVNTKKRAVIRIETQEVFESVEAAKRNGGGDVMSVLLKRQHTAEGYHYAYLDDIEEQERLKNFIGKPRNVFKQKKGVVLKNTQEIFESARAACRKYPEANPTGIGRCCKGLQSFCGKTKKGVKLEWEFYIEGDEE